jgi:restriction system protein
MEQLVAAVFAESFRCEVRHVGGTADRGTDLFLVLGDSVVPIQVKRRTQPGRTESVSVVRDLLGVIFRDQRRAGIIVSTADHFSKHAQRDAEEVTRKRLVESFDLVDVHAFMSLLQTHFGRSTHSYLFQVPEALGGKVERISVATVVSRARYNAIYKQIRDIRRADS